MHRFMFAAAGVLIAAVMTLASPANAQSASPTRSKGKPAKSVAALAGPVNLNTATVVQLDGLPGVGKSTAQRIVDYRQKNGSFKKPEDLMNVKGIGEKAFLKLKPYLTVADRPDKGGF